jgi:hypothetical protein
MALKGHTKIELTNINTGEVEVYEDNNMVTNALEHYFANYGYFGKYQDIYSSKSLSNFLRRFTGGLLLFDTPLEERVDNVLPPGGAWMTGRGCNLTYSGTDTTMGSFSSESKSLYNGHGYQYVWEFNSSQANGKIASACLTTNFGGKMGVGGNTVDSSIALDSNIDAIMTSAEIGGFNQYYDIITINPEDNSVLFLKNARPVTSLNPHTYSNLYYIGCNSGKVFWSSLLGTYPNITQADLDNSFINTHDLVLIKQRFPINNLSIFDFNSTTKEEIKIHLPELDTIITNEMKTLGSANRTCFFTYDLFPHKDCFYFYFSYSFAARNSDNMINLDPNPRSLWSETFNSTLGYAWKINNKTLEIEQFYEIKNLVTGVENTQGAYKGISCAYASHGPESSSSSQLGLKYITEEGIFIGTAAQTDNYDALYTLDLNDQIEAKWITATSGLLPRWPHNTFKFQCCCSYNGKIYGRDQNSSIIRVFDYIDNIYSNLTYQTGWLFYNANTAYISTIDEYVVMIIHSYDKIHLQWFPFMLVTINNLPQEIIKSPEQTMKVTYTIIDDNYKIDD